MWYLIVGFVFVLMAVAGSALKRLPISAAILYLGIGFAIGPNGIAILDLDFQRDAGILELLTEVAVIISLFTAGLKLRAPVRSRVWIPALRLATLGMIITVALIAVVGVTLLDLSLGGAILLGAVMAPTDPVLASDVQTQHPYDRDRLRFSLTAEAGLNDGTAFPFVMLGLGLLGFHELGAAGWRWFSIDLVWATVAGLLVGAISGTAVGRLILYLRREHNEAVGLDDFLTLGLIALSYGAALAIHSYGFLAVFAAGIALRHVEQESTAKENNVREETARPAPPDTGANSNSTVMSPIDDLVEADAAAATDPKKAPAYMARAVLQFNESLERMAEVALVVFVGCLLDLSMLTWQAVLFVILLMCIVRPIAAAVSLVKAGVSRDRLKLIGWFGVRGIGSLYYLAYVLSHDFPIAEGRQLADLALFAVAVSVVIHGTTVTPLMNRYGERHKNKNTQ